VNLFISKGTKGAMHILDKENIPITIPIEFSVKPFLIPKEGNKGDKIENPIPLNIFIKHKKILIFIFKILNYLIYFKNIK
jgi:hypothetical protein